MANKINPMLAKRDAIMAEGYRKQLDVALQMGLDAAMMAANKVLKLGKGRAEEFGIEYMAAIQEIAELIIDDGKDDKDLVYSKEKLDQKICRIVGKDNFEPYDIRYSIQNRHRKRKDN